MQVAAERDAKELARKQAEEISKFLGDVFQSPDPARDGRTITVAETLDTAAKKLETDLADQPDQRARLQATLGHTYQALGLSQQAMLLREEVKEHYFVTLGLEHPDTLTAMQYLAVSYGKTDRQDEALEMQEMVLELRRKVLGPEHPATVRAILGLSDSYAKTGRQEEALEMREAALKLRRKVLGTEHPQTLDSMQDLAYSYAETSRQEESLEIREEVLKLRRKVLGPGHSATLKTMLDVANFYGYAGRMEEATQLREEYSTIKPEDTFLAMRVAALQVWFSKDAEYLATRVRMLKWAKEATKPEDFERVAKISCISPISNDEMRATVLALAQRAVEIGPEKKDLLPYFQVCLGMAEYRSGHYAKADNGLSTAAEILDNGTIKGTANFYRAMSLFQQGKPDEARTLFTQAEAKIKPLPAYQKNPLAGDANHDDLILWLAYKEAKALLAETESPVADSEPDEGTPPAENPSS
ncbi:MAG: hypothetical protein COA78_34925 [Blastopirellula sp.]|nr:MAG: hypothetical protein COA78_34925 [Blastopirellula sp.]